VRVLDTPARLQGAHLPTPSNAYRTTSAECRERERLESDLYNSVRKAAEVHRAVRRYMKRVAVPGVRLYDMCETLEGCVRRLIEEKGLEARLREEGGSAPPLSLPTGGLT